jgi:adenosylcobinamide kinase/adenosylcobinamide-phosphate guanylyltransferase
MVLIFGGAYQGKLDFAMKKFNIKDTDIFTCTEDSFPDFSKKIIDRAELFFLKCVKAGIEPRDILCENINMLQDKIVIARDISQGIVPIDSVQRAWREASGRAMMYLAGEAEEVYRVFCGLSEKLK